MKRLQEIGAAIKMQRVKILSEVICRSPPALEKKERISLFASLLFVAEMWKLFHTNTFSFSNEAQTAKSTEVPIRSAASPNFQLGLRIKYEFLMERMSCLLAPKRPHLIYSSSSALSAIVDAL